jgi:hypothetical protein
MHDEDDPVASKTGSTALGPDETRTAPTGEGASLLAWFIRIDALLAHASWTHPAEQHRQLRYVVSSITLGLGRLLL